ncbi:hypothetical protein ACN9M1_25210 [Ralstonia sp. R-29]|uniref:hypothetical protein n=1 Tax=Ralstonia sp. R-29 TaxID=3404059 RepID=UPI003CEF4B60
MSRSRVLLAVEVLSGVLAIVGLVYLVHALFADVDLAAVRTGPLVFYAGLALFAAATLIVIQIPLVVFALLRRPGIRLRAVVAFLLGIAIFWGCFTLGENRIDRQLPPRESSAQISGQPFGRC